MEKLMNNICKQITDSFMCNSGPEFSPNKTKASFTLTDGNFLDIEQLQFGDFKLTLEIGLHGVFEMVFNSSLEKGPASFEEVLHYSKHLLLAQRTWFALLDKRHPKHTGGCKGCPDLDEEK